MINYLVGNFHNSPVSIQKRFKLSALTPHIITSSWGLGGGFKLLKNYFPSNKSNQWECYSNLTKVQFFIVLSKKKYTNLSNFKYMSNKALAASHMSSSCSMKTKESHSQWCSTGWDCGEGFTWLLQNINSWDMELSKSPEKNRSNHEFCQTFFAAKQHTLSIS